VSFWDYDAYFEEQTIPLMQMTPEVDGKKATIGGLVSTVRSIVTKSGTKMAFVGLEDKTAEGEVIIFPNLYEQVGAKLVQDAVIRVTGKISARDRDGNLGTDAKMIADEVIIVSDEELRGYESTGRKMNTPKVSTKVQAMRVSAARNKKPEAVTTSSAPMESPRPIIDMPPMKKLFVHVRNPDDHDALLALKQICSKYPGVSDIILVLGKDKKSAIKLPFKIECKEGLMGELVKQFGEDCVALK